MFGPDLSRTLLGSCRELTGRSSGRPIIRMVWSRFNGVIEAGLDRSHSKFPSRLTAGTPYDVNIWKNNPSHDETAERVQSGPSRD